MTPDELVAQVHQHVVDWRRHVCRSAQGGGERLCRLVIVGVRADQDDANMPATQAT